MLFKERLFYILNVLNSQSFITVQELVRELKVSKSTIIRDLAELEKQGLIKREHGGAIKKELTETLSNYKEIPIIEKEFIHVEEKKKICEKAASYIKEGDCIFIDSGTTPSYLVNYIGNKKINIVTPSIYLIRKLPIQFQGEIFLVGGRFDIGYDMSLGYHTIEMIKGFHFDHVFFSASGIDIQTGEVFTVDFNICAVKKAVLERTNHKYLLIDDSKFNIKAICTWAKMEEFNHIFINKPKEKIELPKNFVISQ